MQVIFKVKFLIEIHMPTTVIKVFIDQEFCEHGNEEEVWVIFTANMFKKIIDVKDPLDVWVVIAPSWYKWHNIDSYGWEFWINEIEKFVVSVRQLL